MVYCYCDYYYNNDTVTKLLEGGWRWVMDKFGKTTA